MGFNGEIHHYSARFGALYVLDGGSQFCAALCRFEVNPDKTRKNSKPSGRRFVINMIRLLGIYESLWMMT